MKQWNVGAFLACAALVSAAQLFAETVAVRPKATDEALINPDMGFVYYKYSNRLWAYGINTANGDTLDWFPGCSTIYYRLKFADTYYGEMTHYGLYRLAWADVRRRT